MAKKYLILRMRYLTDSKDVRGMSFVRQVVVPATVSLDIVHKVIQAAFGWKDYHMYSFLRYRKMYVLKPIEEPVVKGALKEFSSVDTTIKMLLDEKGKTCLYEYDFGDSNRVEIENVGETDSFDVKDFVVKGQNLVEDSSYFGFTPGIIKLLTTDENPKAKKKCIKWLEDAFELTPEEVLRVPTTDEVFTDVAKVIEECGALLAR